jgi:hypothetical protein
LESCCQQSCQSTKVGGIATIMKGTEVHRDHAGVQEYGCWALAGLAVNNTDNQMSITKAGAITAIMSGMEAHGDQSVVQQQECGAYTSCHAMQKLPS